MTGEAANENEEEGGQDPPQPRLIEMILKRALGMSINELIDHLMFAAKRVTRHHQDAEDAAGDALVSLSRWAVRGRGIGINDPMGYVYRVGTNAAYRIVTQQSRAAATLASEREIAGKAAADAAFEKAREVTTLDDEGNGPSAFGPLGLVQWSWAKAGVVVPCSREAQLQYPAVEESDVRPGDIVMLYQLDLAYAVPTIYYGNGKVVAIITGVGVRIYDLDKLRLWLDVNISIHRPG